MYTQTQKGAGDAYIPSNYRGNALYFEKLHAEDCECEQCREKKTCADEREKGEGSLCGGVGGGHICECKKESSTASFIGKLFSSDNIIVLVILAFFLLSGKDKGEDNTTLLLLLLLLL